MASKTSVEDAKRMAGIGIGIELSIVQDALPELEVCPAEDVYKSDPRYRNAAFEILTDHEMSKVVKDTWLQGKENMERIARYMRRPVPDNIHDVVDGWATIRMKTMPGRGTIPGFASPGQTVVLIALDRWDESNGFFLSGLRMEAGEDISLDGGQVVSVPGSGGGLVVLITLNL